MADCCTELKTELAALRAEVAKIKPVNEQAIINKATQISEAAMFTQLGAYAPLAAYKVLDGKVKFLGNGLENIRDTTNALGTKVNTVNKVANSAKVATDSLGRTVIDQSSRLGNVGNAVANLDLKMAGALSSFAALNATVNSALARLTPLFNILGLVGALAGLAALAGIIYTVFPRLDAHDYELQSIQSQLAKDSSAIFNLTMQARNAKVEIDKAQYSAEIANRQALDALRQGLNATYSAATAQSTAETAINRANSAQSQANNAINAASIAQSQANEAINRANNAQGRATEAINAINSIQGKANDAIVSANNAQNKANEAIANANNAQNKANDAIANANNAQNKANDAIAKANNLINEVALLKPQINAATTKSNQTDQKLKQQEIMNQQGLQRIEQLPTVLEPTIVNAVTKSVAAFMPISIEQSSADIKKTFNDISTNNAKAFESQFQKTIDANKSEIAKLNNTVTQGFKDTKNPNPAIVQPGTGIATVPSNKELQDQIRLGVGALTVGLAGVTALVRPIANNTSPSSLQNNTAAAVCQTAQPGGCLSNLANSAANNAANLASNNILKNLGNILNTGATAAQLLLLRNIQAGVNAANTKLGPLMRGSNGISGFLSRVSTSMGVDRALNLIAIASNLHNAMMLSANLKITLLEMLSSVGNATGLLQTPDGENVDLNQVFNAGIETVLIKILGVDSYAGLKVGLRKYNAIYQAASNSLNAVSSMFNSIGNVVEQGAEYTGKIGNSLKGAGLVAENAYSWMSEKFDAKSSKFIKFQSTIGDITQVLETINEIAETVVEGQQSATEFQKANTEFIKAVQDAKKGVPIENKQVKEEAAKAKENATKDPTGEIDTGLLSFLSN